MAVVLEISLRLDTNTVTPEDRVPQVPICYVEALTGDIISANREITSAVDDIIQNVGEFLEGIEAVGCSSKWTLCCIWSSSFY